MPGAGATGSAPYRFRLANHFLNFRLGLSGRSLAVSHAGSHRRLAIIADLVKVEQQQLAISLRSDLNGIFVIQRGTALSSRAVQRRRATAAQRRLRSGAITCSMVWPVLMQAA